ncbi:MAG: exodeoxyribonuclease VII small subunit [Synechococcaceae cyanobacterium]|nr:exodeoxyribonuclease VII small subunit [Synechococcaceae cyanobacterium]
MAAPPPPMARAPRKTKTDELREAAGGEPDAPQQGGHRKASSRIPGEVRSARVEEAAADAPPVADLSFREAQAALELCLAQLQSSDLDVEAMAALHRRAQAYADRCEAILRSVEQEVMRWDPEHPDLPPGPYEP